MTVRARLLRVLLVLGLLTLVAAGAVYAFRPQRQADPRTVFSAALEQAMSQSGVTCTTKEVRQDVTTVRQISVNLQDPPQVRAVTSVQHGKLTVRTEEIVTGKGSFVRYIHITPGQKNAAGQELDLGKVLNVWGKKPAVDSPAPGLYGRTVLGDCIIPLADQAGAKAEAFAAEALDRKAFSTVFGSARKAVLTGQDVLVYDVTIEPKAYIVYMKRIAAATGRRDLDRVDSTAYARRSPEKAKFYVTTDTPRVVKIEYAAAKRTVSFRDYGKAPQISAPESSVSATELESHLQRR
ncbi:MAG TPA: hypothetical protein VF572_02580 [Candidatus Saccharimonadales bacterium]|jgi:hypothetical protein